MRLPFRFGVRAKLFLASVSVIAIAVVVAHAYLSSALDRMLTERIRDDLFVRLDLVALVLATVMSFLTAQLSSRVVGHLTNIANAMAKGNFDARARLGGGDEFAELGRALDQLADSLSVTVRQLRAERDRVGRILSGMQEGVLLLDTEGRIAFLNGALRQMLLVGTDTVGKTPFEVIQNEELKKL